MTTLEAIQEIAEKDTLIGQVALNAIEDDNLDPFIQYIKDQYNDGNGASMAITYGYNVINTIIKEEEEENTCAYCGIETEKQFCSKDCEKEYEYDNK